jgi:hypothetical protein
VHQACSAKPSTPRTPPLGLRPPKCSLESLLAHSRLSIRASFLKNLESECSSLKDLESECSSLKDLESVEHTGHTSAFRTFT